MINSKIYDLEELIDSKRLEFGLSSLHHFKINQKGIYSVYFDSVRKGRCKYRFEFDKIIDDLVFLSDEIVYFTAYMYLLRPYINDPLNDAYLHNNRIVYPNKVNLESYRYSMFSDTVSEKLYNYWDRLGDLLWAYFQNLLIEKKVFYPDIIDKIGTPYNSSLNYEWLLNFRNNEYKTLNNKRKRIVHYSSSDIDYKYEHLGNFTDKTLIEQLMSERLSLPDYFKEQLELTKVGFEKMIYFIDEITIIDCKDIE